jgi:HK97 family phage prohead protease
MDKQFINAVLKKENDQLTFVASDETLDRGGEVIPIESWDLKNYSKNPVLLVNHDYQVQNIVGKATNIRIEDKKLLFDPVFHGITQLAKEVEAMVKEGILDTVSVGFMPHGPEKDGESIKNELFEISFVPVPANPSASRLSAVMAKSVDDVEIKQVDAWVNEVEEKEVKVEPEVKEGRVLSNRNRKLINDSIEILKQAAMALDDLLAMTDASAEKDSEDIKGREPKVVKVQKDKVVPSAVLRALQGINRETNDLLRNYKR